MKSLGAIIAVLSCLAAGNACAGVSVSEQVMQKGQFTKSGCQPDPKDPDYDECVCDADVRYPQLSGVTDAAVQGKFNDWFKEQAAKTVCEGDASSSPVKDGQSAKAHMSVSVHYEVTFSSAHLLAFKFTDWAYTGGAHGNGSIIGVIADLDKGRLLTPTDVFSAKNMDAVNKAIYDALSAKPEEEIFRDQIESRKGAFIKDGECQGCTLILNPQGVSVLFQTYEVAPYGAGDTAVPIPAKLVADKAVKEALK
jgi:hypothetical protein